MDPAINALINPLTALLCSAAPADQGARHDACRQIACSLVSGAAPEDLNILLRELQSAVVKVRSGVSPSQLLPQRYMESQWCPRSEASATASAAAATAVATALAAQRELSCSQASTAVATALATERELSSQAMAASEAEKEQLKSRLLEVEAALSSAQHATSEATILCEQYRIACDDLGQRLEDHKLAPSQQGRNASAETSDLPPPKRRQVTTGESHAQAPQTLPQKRGSMVMAPTPQSGDSSIPRPKLPGMRSESKPLDAKNGNRLLRPGSKIVLPKKASPTLPPNNASESSASQESPASFVRQTRPKPAPKPPVLVGESNSNGDEHNSITLQECQAKLESGWQDFLNGAAWDKVWLELSSQPKDMMISPLLRLASESADERTLVIASVVCDMVKSRELPLGKLVQAVQSVVGELSSAPDFEASWRTFSLNDSAKCVGWQSRQRLLAWVLVHLFPQMSGTTWGWSCLGWTWNTWWASAQRCLEHVEPRAAFGIILAVIVLLQDVSGLHFRDFSSAGDKGVREFRQRMLQLGDFQGEAELDEALANSGVEMEQDTHAEDDGYEPANGEFMALPVEPPNENEEIWPASPGSDAGCEENAVES